MIYKTEFNRKTHVIFLNNHNMNISSSNKRKKQYNKTGLYFVNPRIISQRDILQLSLD